MNQIYYTQCPIGYGLGASSGFQIKRLSPGFPVSSDYRHFSLRAFVGGTRLPAPATLRYRRGEGDIAEIAWQEYPGHFGGALSKALVRPETCGSRRIDHRISCYQPMAHVAEHVHRVQEQVYHVLEGEGLLTLDDQRHLMRRHDYVFVPPFVPHREENPDPFTEAVVVIARSTQEAIVVNLDSLS